MKPEHIRAIRYRLQMSQAEFARKLGLSHRASVCRLESGERVAQGALLELLRLLDKLHPERNLKETANRC